MGKEKGWKSDEQEKQSGYVKQVSEGTGITIAVVLWFLVGSNRLPGNEFLFWVIDQFSDTEGEKTCRQNKDTLEKIFR